MRLDGSTGAGGASNRAARFRADIKARGAALEHLRHGASRFERGDERERRARRQGDALRPHVRCRRAQTCASEGDERAEPAEGLLDPGSPSCDAPAYRRSRRQRRQGANHIEFHSVSTRRATCDGRSPLRPPVAPPYRATSAPAVGQYTITDAAAAISIRPTGVGQECNQDGDERARADRQSGHGRRAGPASAASTSSIRCASSPPPWVKDRARPERRARTIARARRMIAAGSRRVRRSARHTAP